MIIYTIIKGNKAEVMSNNFYDYMSKTNSKLTKGNNSSRKTNESNFIIYFRFK